jgi:dihydroorotate dehydrogenase
MYRLVFRLILQRINVEVAHRIASSSLRAITRVPGVAGLIRWRLGRRDQALMVSALGLHFPSPLGVAAGVDKDASWFESLGLLGFGFVEVGTVTARAQMGNPPPRVFRIPKDKALLNKMGFPNPGAQEIAARLRRRTGRVIIGVNVGKSMGIPNEDAIADYRATVRETACACDYLVVNVSSPNTPGLTEMQSIEMLRPLVEAVKAELSLAGAANLPVLLKIGPDVSDVQIDAMTDLAVELSLDGIVAVNTTERRDDLSTPSSIAAVTGGGISGAPLKARSLEILQRLYARAGDKLTLISVGGISTPDDAWERILAGATLLQAHTGFIYGGPAWPAHVNRALARHLRDAGAASIQDVIGASARSSTQDAVAAQSSPARRVQFDPPERVVSTPS